MIDKEKLMENWDELKAETKTRILELADKEIKEDYFVPKEGEEYYYYDFSCEIGGISSKKRTCSNSNFDIFNIGIGNVFRTQEEAEFAGKCDYFIKRFETYVNRHSKKLDWNDYDIDKYYIYYDIEDRLIFYDSQCFNKPQGTVYSSSEQILKDAIADIGEENFLKYVMKVER